MTDGPPALDEELRGYLDGTLPTERRRRVEERAAREPALRRLLDEHACVWRVLDEAYRETAEASRRPHEAGAFRAQALANVAADRRRAAWGRRGRWAAALLLTAAGAAAVFWEGALPSASDDRDVVRHLHLLHHVGLLDDDVYGGLVDLRADFEVWLAFDGELEGGGG